MCGIAGFILFNNINEENHIQNMINSLKRRGPDSDNYNVVKNYGNTYVLGHTRLSIIDLSELGNQPMENDKYIIVLNGEIYNYQTIREDLINKGIKFTSLTDTEVVLECITYYGIEKALIQFRGMWAFSILDKESGKIILCRDRIGVKPLYYYYHNDCLLFGSELKALMSFPYFEKNIDKTSLFTFFKYGYINAPNSIFRNTHKVLPGEYIVFDNNGAFTKQQYWSIESIYQQKIQLCKYNSAIGLDSYLERLNDTLCDSFNLRMVSDVPVGVFLSGGVDSSLLVSLLKNDLKYNLDTFTIGFDIKEYDESYWARQIAKHLNTNHNEFICTEKEALELIYELPKVFDEPFGDSSAIPTMLVSRFARQKVKVSLSADGGDELFFGYSIYKKLDTINQTKYKAILGKMLNIIPDDLPESIYEYVKKIKLIPGFKDKVVKLKNILNSKNLASMYDSSLSYYTNDELKKLLGENFVENNNNENIYDNVHDLTFLTDLQNYLPGDILTKVDRASMAFSLEARDPFLDHHIIEFAAETPFKFKFNNGEQKYALKKLLERHLPENLIYRDKKGFAIPIDKWFHGDLKPIVTYYLSEAKLNEHGLFNNNYIQDLLIKYYKNKGINSHKIWFLLMFQMWYEEWIKNT